MAKKPAVLELPVSFSNVNVGDKTVRIGASIDRVNLTVKQADVSLCGRRLWGKIMARPQGAREDQKAFLKDDLELEGVMDVKGFSASTKKIAIGLTFVIHSIDIKKMVQFAKRDGTLIVNKVQDLPDDADEEEGEDDGDE